MKYPSLRPIDTMYDEVMRTFVMVKPPRNSDLPRDSFQGAVSHLDITATIPDILGMEVPASFQGRPVFQPGGSRPVFMHSNALVPRVRRELPKQGATVLAPTHCHAFHMHVNAWEADGSDCWYQGTSNALDTIMR